MSLGGHRRRRPRNVLEREYGENGVVKPTLHLPLRTTTTHARTHTAQHAHCSSRSPCSAKHPIPRPPPPPNYPNTLLPNRTLTPSPPLHCALTSHHAAPSGYYLADPASRRTRSSSSASLSPSAYSEARHFSHSAPRFNGIQHNPSTRLGTARHGALTQVRRSLVGEGRGSENEHEHEYHSDAGNRRKRERVGETGQSEQCGETIHQSRSSDLSTTSRARRILFVDDFPRGVSLRRLDGRDTSKGSHI